MSLPAKYSVMSRCVTHAAVMTARPICETGVTSIRATRHVATTADVGMVS
ncbi:Uncharacterised protein [Mycobacteroides abscessus subsp. abscessus]|nr:Uncharacterised protein [Mycobacteroides abscessus subsp. abscessus]